MCTLFECIQHVSYSITIRIETNQAASQSVSQPASQLTWPNPTMPTNSKFHLFIYLFNHNLRISELYTLLSIHSLSFYQYICLERLKTLLNEMSTYRTINVYTLQMVCLSFATQTTKTQQFISTNSQCAYVLKVWLKMKMKTKNWTGIYRELQQSI